MDERTCGSCRHYRPSEELARYGTCMADQLWSARPQEVLEDMYACAELGSQWMPIGGPDAPCPAAGSPPSWVGWARWLGIVGLVVSPLIFGIDMFLGIPAVPEFTILWVLISASALAAGLLWGRS